MASISGGVDARELGLSWDTTGHGLHLIFPFSLSTGDAYGHFTELFIYYYPGHFATCFSFFREVLSYLNRKLSLILWLLSRPVISFFRLPSLVCGPRTVALAC